MPMSELTRHNLYLLSLVNPELAHQIDSISTAHLKISYPAQKRNLQVCSSEPFYFLHSPTEALQEAQEQFESLNLHQIEILYVYGMGAGYFYLAALPWLEENPQRSLIFLEDDLAVIRLLLDTELGSLILKDLQVEIYSVAQCDKDPSILFKLIQNHPLRSATLVALPSYQENKNTFFKNLLNHFLFEAREQYFKNKQIASFGLNFFSNFYPNLLNIPSSYKGEKLFNQFNGIPAIICGAGPSLLDSLPFLKSLNNQALIFAPGSALNILSAHGVTAHFGMNIDSMPETFQRIVTNRAFETPIFYYNSLYHEALTTIHGPHLLLGGAESQFNTMRWFEQKLNLDSQISSGGYSVMNAAVATAYSLGCNPLILVGTDLCFSSNHHYAPGVEKHPLFPYTDNKAYLGEPIAVTNTKGQPVLTYWTWILQAHWLDTFAHDHPHVDLINASIEGLQLFSIPHSTLEDIKNTYFNQTYDLTLLVHQAIQQAGLTSVTSQQILSAMHEFQQSLLHCQSFYQNLIDQLECDSVVEPLIREQPDNIAHEIAYEYLLKRFNDVFDYFIWQDTLKIRRLTHQPNEQNKLQKNALKARYTFLSETIQIHLKLIEQTINQANLTSLDQKAPDYPIKYETSHSHETLFYYKSGEIYSKQRFENNVPDGLQLFYYPNGNLKTELHYQHGLLNGVTRLYYPNGQLKRELHFLHNQRQGLEKSWYENGQLSTEVDYANNQAKGARAWYPDGTLAKEITR